LAREHVQGQVLGLAGRALVTVYGVSRKGGIIVMSMPARPVTPTCDVPGRTANWLAGMVARIVNGKHQPGSMFHNGMIWRPSDLQQPSDYPRARNRQGECE
jgi:hypothetical protein